MAKIAPGWFWMPRKALWIHAQSIVVRGISAAIFGSALMLAQPSYAVASSYFAIVAETNTTSPQDITANLGPSSEQGMLQPLSQTSVNSVTTPHRSGLDDLEQADRSMATRSFYVTTKTNLLASNVHALTIKILATRVFRGSNAEIWLQNTLFDNASLASQEKIDSISRDLINSIVETTAQFGPLNHNRKLWQASCFNGGGSIEADSYVRLLIVKTGIIPYENGYSDLSSYYQKGCFPKAITPTNEVSGLIVFSAAIESLEANAHLRLQARFCHEIQHLINFARHDAHQDAFFMDEGLSMLAQDFVVNDRSAVARNLTETAYVENAFFRNPERCNILNIFSPRNVLSKNDVLLDYGCAYALQRYLYDRFGPAYLEDIKRDQDHVGVYEIEHATHESFHETLIGFISGLWLGLADTSVFGHSRNVFLQNSPTQFLNIQSIDNSTTLRLIPNSISFWSTSGQIPTIRLNSTHAHLTVIKLGDEVPRASP